MKKRYLNRAPDQYYMATAVRDLLDILHEKWLPVDRENAIKRMLVEMIDRMEDSTNVEDLR